MLAALIITFRESIEAGLIVGIVLAVTNGVPSRGLWVTMGLVGGVLGALAIAFFTDAIAYALAGIGQEVLNAAVLALATLMLSWHNIWMARHGRVLAAEMREVGEAVARGRRPLAALAIVIGIAVLREGAEVVLFFYSLLVSGTHSYLDLVLGGGLGLGLGCLVSLLTFLGLIHIPSRYLFGVTTLLITFLAAGLAAQSIAFLQQAGVFTILTSPLWDTSYILSDSSLLGRILHTLVGYTDQPSQMQVLVYITVLVGIFSLTKGLNRTRKGVAR